MDALTLAIEAIFILVFVAAAADWWRRRDAVSRDVVVVFGALVALFVVSFLAMAIGPLPRAVTAVAVAALLAQPLAALRLAADLRPVPRLALVAAAVGWAATTVPIAVLGAAVPRPITLAAIAVFVVTQTAAAAYITGAARRRSGAARIRLWIAAVASGLIGLAIFAAGAGALVEGSREAASAIARILGLLSAIGYLVAFAPPRFLRRMLQADTAYAGLATLVGPADADVAGVWRRYLAIAVRATGASGGYVVAGTTDERRIVVEMGLDPGLVGHRTGADDGRGDGHGRVPGATTDAPARPNKPIDTETDLASLRGLDGMDLAEAPVRAIGARFGQAIRLGDEAGAPLAVVVSTHRSLFGDEDRQLLGALGRQAAGVVAHLEALAGQERLTDQLAALVEALRSASQAKSDFLASMSHELRTPLNAIIGFSDLMRREAVDADGNVVVPLEWVEHIRRGGSHLVELVNDVLDLSRVEAGRLELDREAFDVQAAIGESVAGLRPLADRKGLTIEVTVVAGDQIVADRGRFRQVLYNLLSNAIKFTPEGGQISVEGRRTGDGYVLAVADTGIGIEPDDLAVVFDEFRQVGKAGQRSEGSGLGLALTRRLVEAHGGRIEVVSTPGAGTTFTVTFPDAPLGTADGIAEVGPAGESAVAASATTGSAPAERQAASVLVVEDDPSAVRLLHAYLEPEGYRVRVAADGEAALEAIRREPPAAILLDVLLPGMDGWEVLRRLKADPELRAIPVVIVTVVDERDVGLALGAVDYLVKPIDRAALLASLDRLALTSNGRGRAVRILAVDDEPAALDMLTATLRPAGFDIVRAESGMAAIGMARAERPDLVICDLVMPDLDGFGVVAALKADPATAAIPIIILTGYDLTPADKKRLNGKVLRIVSKGAAAQAGLRAWLIRADAVGSATRPVA